MFSNSLRNRLRKFPLCAALSHLDTLARFRHPSCSGGGVEGGGSLVNHSLPLGARLQKVVQADRHVRQHAGVCREAEKIRGWEGGQSLGNGVMSTVQD